MNEPKYRISVVLFIELSRLKTIYGIQINLSIILKSFGFLYHLISNYKERKNILTKNSSTLLIEINQKLYNISSCLKYWPPDWSCGTIIIEIPNKIEKIVRTYRFFEYW